jgi:uncharacterized protein (TIGR02246 family)
MSHFPSHNSDELRFREKFFRIGCVVNIVLFVLMLVIPAIFVPAVARVLGLSTPSVDESAIRSVLDAQVSDWNKEDIDGFMTGYWRHEELTFISGGEIRQGWTATRERFVKKYKEGKSTMGKLTFDELHVESFSPTAAMVRGRYQLVMPEKTDSGRFTLAFRKFSDGWRIVHDHTSISDITLDGKKNNDQ